MRHVTRASDTQGQEDIELRLQNFRLFEDTGWLRLAPLTCIVGRNSSGKSSVISALLLLKQSIEKETYGAAITPLTLSGQYCDLGQFRDVVHNHDEKRAISFSFRLPAIQIATFRRKAAAPLIQLTSPQFTLGGYAPYSFGRNRPLDEGNVTVRLTFSEDEPFGPSLSRCEIDISEIGQVRFVRTITGERKQHWRTYSNMPVLRPLTLVPSQPFFFPRIVPRRSRLERMNPRHRRIFQRVLWTCVEFFAYLDALLRRSEMIGPFRQRPDRRYAFAGFGTESSGPSGEQSVDLLITEALIRKGRELQLVSAVSYWLKRLKLAETIKIRDIAKHLNLFEVDVRLTGQPIRTTLADVGFGVSQVLPVIVQGLLMQPGGMYFVQEPEIHLHPDAQAGLADFFIYLSAQGVRTIIETHSEYLLLRLRRRLAEKSFPARSARPRFKVETKRFTPQGLSVLFSHAAGTRARIERLEIGKGFQFENLPAGFMSQITEDRMALLEAASKRHG